MNEDPTSSTWNRPPDVHDSVIDLFRQGEGYVVELRALISDRQVGYEWLSAH